MKRCENCKAIISYTLMDVMGVREVYNPKKVTVESGKYGLCEECFNDGRVDLVSHKQK